MVQTYQEYKRLVEGLPEISLPISALKITGDVKQKSSASNEDAVDKFHGLFMDRNASIPALIVSKMDGENLFSVEDGRTRLLGAKRAGVKEIKVKVLPANLPRNKIILYAGWGGNEQQQSQAMTYIDRVHATMCALQEGTTPEEVRDLMRNHFGTSEKDIRNVLADAQTRLKSKLRLLVQEELKSEPMADVAARNGLTVDELVTLIAPKTHKVADSKKTHGQISQQAIRFQSQMLAHLEETKGHVDNANQPVKDAAETVAFMLNKIRNTMLSIEQAAQHDLNQYGGKKPRAIVG